MTLKVFSPYLFHSSLWESKSRWILPSPDMFLHLTMNLAFCRQRPGLAKLPFQISLAESGKIEYNYSEGSQTSQNISLSYYDTQTRYLELFRFLLCPD